MRLLLAIIVIIYLVGVGVVLSPIVRSTWNKRARLGFCGPHCASTARSPRLARPKAVHAFLWVPAPCCVYVCSAALFAATLRNTLATSAAGNAQ